jgi:hypothetical protein
MTSHRPTSHRPTSLRPTSLRPSSLRPSSLRRLLPLAAIALALPALAAAAAAPVPDPANLGDFFQALLAAAASGQWKVVAGLAIVAAVWAIRSAGARAWPFLATDSGGAWVVFVTGVLGAVGGALAAGEALSWSVVVAGVGLAWTAGGAWSGVRKMLRPLVGAAARIPRVGASVSRVLAFLSGADLAAEVRRATAERFEPTAGTGPAAADAERDLFEGPTP